MTRERLTWVGPLARFGAASVASTLVTLAGLGALLQWTSLPAVWANVLATTAGTLLAYELNRRWVWGGERREQRLRDLLAFWALSLLGLALSTAAVGAVQHVVDAARVTGAARTLDLQATNFGAFAALTVLKLLLSHSMFGRARRDRGGPP